MLPVIRQSLSRNVLRSLIKPGSGGGSLDYNKVLGNVTGIYKALSISSSEVQIPLPSSEKPRVRPEELTDVEIEQAIVPLFDYFDANLMTLNTYLSDTTKEQVMSRVWKEILGVVEGLLIPPLSDLASDMKPLSDKEVDIVFKWLKVCATVTILFQDYSQLSLVPARLLLCWWGGACTCGDSTEPEVSGRGIHQALL
jgi:hypothetical protein